MTKLNTQIELIVSEIIGTTRKAKTLEDLAQANTNGINHITKLVKNIAVTHCCKSDSELLADKGKYCYKCGDYVGEGCDNVDCNDFKG